jgi:transposase
MDTTSLILKRDSRGRVRTPLEQREALLDEFEGSGLPATKFAAMAGVRYQTFATWVQKRRREAAAMGTGLQEAKASAVAEATLRLVEAVREEDSVAAGVRIELPGGAGLELRRPDQAGLVAALLKSLATSPSASC